MTVETELDVVNMDVSHHNNINHSAADEDDDIEVGRSNRSNGANANSRALTLKDVTYDIKVGGKKIRLLHGITLSVCGQFLAIMGSSGAGKTTLLNLIAARYNKGKVGGVVAFGNENLDKHTIKKHGGYVMQDDVLFGDLTVRDTLRYAALLRLPSSVSLRQKFEDVETLMVKLGLAHCANTRIGDPLHRGVSGGERKRVAIGQQMIARPQILMLDEPTSGLDSMAALVVVKLLRRIASEGTTVITTIHQPSSKIYDLFDMLLVLSHGEVAYFGPADTAVSYFAELGFECPPHYNPADFLLDTCSADPSNPDEVEQARLNSAILVEEYKKNKASSKETADAGSTPKLKRTRYWPKANIIVQFLVLLVRSAQCALLSWRMILLQLLVTVTMAFLIGGAFWKIPITDQYINRRFSALFFLAINQGVIAAFTVINVFPKERIIILRERASGMYSTLPYFLAKSLAELPIQIALPFIFVMIVYWMIGLQNDFVKWVHLTLIIEFCAIAATSMALAISALAKEALFACIMAPFLLELFRLFGGFYNLGTTIHASIDWINYLSYVRWAWEGVSDNEFRGLEFEIVTRTGPNGTKLPPISGEQVLKNYKLEDASYWKSELILIGMIIGWRIIGYFALRFNKR